MSEETRTPEEWADSMSITVLDPDGWRIDGKDFEERITREEFERRLIDSTIKLMHQPRNWPEVGYSIQDGGR